MNDQQNIYRQRHNFSKFRSLVPIPNLIDIQRRSFDDFLQINLLHSERENRGLNALFESIFPVHNGKLVDGSDATFEVEFLGYTLGHWACKCEELLGPEHLRTQCKHCSHSIVSDHPKDFMVECPKCGTQNKNAASICDVCQEPVTLKQWMSREECVERNSTMSAPLKIRIRLNEFDLDDEGNRHFKQSSDAESYFADLPIMTDHGTFIINGTERVVVCQLLCSPGVYFTFSKERNCYSAKIVPHRGSTIEFELDHENGLHVCIDDRFWIRASTFLQAIGLGTGYIEENQSLLALLFPTIRIFMEVSGISSSLDPFLIGRELLEDIVDPDFNVVIADCGDTIDEPLLERLKRAGIIKTKVDETLLKGAVFTRDVRNIENGTACALANEKFDTAYLLKFNDAQIDFFEICFPDINPISLTSSDEAYLQSPEISGSVETDETVEDDVEGGISTVTVSTAPIRDESEDNTGEGEGGEEEESDNSEGTPLEGLTGISRLRKLILSRFYDSDNFDLGDIGRLKINEKFGLSTDPGLKTLSIDDFLQTIHYLLRLKTSGDSSQVSAAKASVCVDDLDHLRNRRVWTASELLESIFRNSLALVRKTTTSKLHRLQEPDCTLQIQDLVRSRKIFQDTKQFFSSSQLSQFMDQTNPLSEITHKRRLTALGPGGLSRDRAGFEVRDVHTSHYGRICPIETPEGPNIGLISSLSCYARINKFGFIESPYLKVENGKIVHFAKVTSVGDSKLGYMEVVRLSDLEEENMKLTKAGKRPAKYDMHAFYLSAWEEDAHLIAQANVRVDKDGAIQDEDVTVRFGGEIKIVSRDKVTLMDVSPKQVVSVAASLIPFLENNDANRALMGANMQRQAVPLIRTEAPIVGTGMEYVAAKDSGTCVVCRRSGIVETVDANRIVVRVEDDLETEGNKSGVDIYTLVKFARSNQNTCLNQTPLVKKGEYVTAGQILADGPCTDQGELALGRNLVVAYMPWRGYNFEDAILISERVVKEDLYTTIHIEEFEVHARDTKLGPEEITRDIPLVREEALKNLDDSGIIRIGATVKHGDILVGKVTPKGETILSPEEKLLRAIFGEKASDVKDASLTVPPGIEGNVVDIKVFTRKGQEKDLRTQQIERDKMAKWEKDLSDEERIIRAEGKKKVVALLKGKELDEDLNDDNDKVMLPKGMTPTQNMLEAIPYHCFRQVSVATDKNRINALVLEILDQTESQLKVLRDILNERMERLLKGDDLMPGVLKIVKCFVAVKRKLQVGDKMASRHGNKGVVSRILPVEDMPYLPDGRPVDIVLNPLGVPSHMNIGQVLECHLGWAGKTLGVHFSTPVFDGAREADIKGFLVQAWEKNNKLGPDVTGKTRLYDGMTGEAFEQPVNVGCVYMLKLHHLVDNKIHARSIGPYSLITQQPLGGKAQFGGQRFGEMEVWALEAYGAAHVLQELLTYKSDDMHGRTQIFQAIIKGEPIKDPGLPESFNVVRKELNALCIDVEMLTREELNSGLAEEDAAPFSIEG